MHLPGGLVKLLVQAASGEPISIGSVVGTTLETIVQIVDHPETKASGEPITPADLEARILEAIARAEQPLRDISNVADAELAKLNAAAK
jgi:hypothetical protein